MCLLRPTKSYIVPNLYSILMLFFVLTLQSAKGQNSSNDIFNSDWNKVTITKWVKPEFNLSNYSNIIVAEILNDRNRKDNETQIIYNKIANKIHQMTNVNLLDREKTELILKEYKLQSSGYVEEDYVTPFGKFFSSGLIMTGRILNSNYQKELNSFKVALSNSTKKYRKGTYNISFGIQFIDIATTEIVYSKTIEATFFIETKPNYNSPPQIDENQVFIGCVNKLSKVFKNLFVPHEVDYKITFQKNSKYNNILKSAAALIEVEEFDMAHDQLTAILEDKKVLKSDKAISSAYYNLAIFQLYIDKYELAKFNAKQGYLKNPNNNECLTLIKILQ